MGMDDLTDGISDAATQFAIGLAMEIEAQLGKAGPRFMPLAAMLVEHRKKAKIAMSGLVEVDPTKTDDIRALQNEIKLYHDMIAACQKAYCNGREMEHRLDEQDRDAVYRLIQNDWATAENLGATEVNDR